MRNGIYRVWLSGPGGKSSGAYVFKNGDVLACDRSFAFTGSYRKKNDRLTAEISCRRLNLRRGPECFPDLDAFHLKLEGGAGREFAVLNGTIPEAPNFLMSFEFAWLCDA